MGESAPGPTVPLSDAVLRLSLTDRCNLRCRYCVPVFGIPRVARAELLTLEELTAATLWLCRSGGVRRVKLTGGEPLVRAGVVELVRVLAAADDVDEVSGTTNGVRLPALAHALAEAGLRRVNVSLDTLDPERFAELTRGGRIEETLAGIDAARAAGLRPVKLNAVLMASSWRRDVPALLDFAGERDLEVRFIELMRTGTEAAWCERELVSAAEVRRGLGLPEIGDREGTTTARGGWVPWRGSAVRVGWITPRSRPFCAGCRRLRLDARGRLRRCLMDPTLLPLAELLRTTSGAAVAHRLRDYLAGKVPAAGMGSGLPMASIGG